jgi:hypothetical protein
MCSKVVANCLFCEKSAGSKEHLWAKWIHERKDFGPLDIRMGDGHEWIAKNPQQKINTVSSVLSVEEVYRE